MLEKKKFITATIVFFTLCVFAAPALAVRDLGEVAEGITTQSEYVGSAVVAIGVIVGIVFVILGIVQLKNSGTRGDASVAKGLGAIVLGVLLVCIIAFTSMGGKTVFGDETSLDDRVSSF